MKTKETKDGLSNYMLIIVCVVALLVACFFIFHVPGIWPQLLAIITSAFLGAIVTATVTRMLIGEQTQMQSDLQKQQAANAEKIEKENRDYLEKKEKEDREFRIKQEENQRKFEHEQETETFRFQQDLQEKIQLRNNKIKAYSDFTAELYSILNKNTSINELDLEKIRTEIFSKLIFYVDPSTLEKLSELSEEIHKDKSQLFSNLSSITSILRDEILQNKDANDTAPQMVSIWQNLSFTTSVKNSTKDISSLSMAGLFWHFAMLGDEQIKALDKGTNELSLIEYEESWRTDLLKQVGENDIVFLFRRGGYGYIGAFRPKGWRIFEYDDDEKLYETIHWYGEEEDVIVTEDASVNADVEKYDIYKGIKNTADFCSNLMVEPLVLDYNGVSYPGGVYRRTISRYDNGYAKEVLSRFMTKKDDPSFNKIEENGETINVRTDLFEKLTRNLHPAERDENGYWK